MPTLAVALAPSFWMTYCVLVLRQDLLTVQGLPVRELGHMTSVQEAMVKMPVSDVPYVSLGLNFHTVGIHFSSTLLSFHLVGIM